MHTHAHAHALSLSAHQPQRLLLLIHSSNKYQGLSSGSGAAVGPGKTVYKVQDPVLMEKFVWKKHHLILERPGGARAPLRTCGLSRDPNFGTRMRILGPVISHFGGRTTFRDSYLCPLSFFFSYKGQPCKTDYCTCDKGNAVEAILPLCHSLLPYKVDVFNVLLKRVSFPLSN